MRGLRTAPASSASTICASEEEENREKCCVERRIKNCKRPHILSIPLFLELQELHETQELEGCQRRYTSTSTRTVQSMPTTTNGIVAIILALSDTSSLPIAPKKIAEEKQEQIRRDIYLGKQRGRGERASTRPSSQSSPERLLTSPRLRRKAFENFNSLGNKFRMRGVVATKGNQSASEHPAAVHGALLTPATITHTTKAQNSPTEHHKLHLPSSHFTSANPPFCSSHRMPQIFRTRFPTRRRRNRISIGRKLRKSLRRARKFARSDVDQTLANPNAT